MLASTNSQSNTAWPESMSIVPLQEQAHEWERHRSTVCGLQSGCYLAVVLSHRCDGPVQQHGQEAALTAAADRADDRAAALTVYELNCQYPQHKGPQLLWHCIARQQQRNQVLHHPVPGM